MRSALARLGRSRNMFIPAILTAMIVQGTPVEVDAFERDGAIVVYAVTTEALDVVQPLLRAHTTGQIVLVSDSQVRQCDGEIGTDLDDACLIRAARRAQPEALLLIRANVTRGRLALHWMLASPLFEASQTLAVSDLQARARDIRGFAVARLDALSDMVVALQPTLEEVSLLQPKTELRVRAEPADAEAQLDERLAVTVPASGLRLRGASVGPHVLLVRKDGYLTEERTFDLVTDFEVELSLRRDHRAERVAAGITGLALVAGGLAVGAVGLVEADDAARARNRDFGGYRFFGSSPSQITFEDEVNSGGPLAAGLAGGLVASGGLLSVLGLADQEAQRSVWIDIAISLAAGAVTYGIAELAN